jgi:hypothetical protein
VFQDSHTSIKLRFNEISQTVSFRVSKTRAKQILTRTHQATELISEVRTQKKLGFWIGFGWETQNPKKIQKSKKSKIQTQKKSKNPKNPKSKPKKNPKIQKIQNPNPKKIQIQYFFLVF